MAPLTTTAMMAVETQHAGVASGVNNAVSRVAGLIAIAVFGIALVRIFNARVGPALDQLRLPADARAALDRRLQRQALYLASHARTVPIPRETFLVASGAASLSSPHVVLPLLMSPVSVLVTV